MNTEKIIGGLICCFMAIFLLSGIGCAATINLEGDSLICEMYDNVIALKGDNLAQAPGTTAEASSERPGCAAVKAIDSDPATAWVPNTNAAWLKITLPEVTKINAIFWLWTTSSDNTRSPKDYEVKISTDNQNWQTVVNVSGNITGIKTHRFPEVEAKYVLFDIKTTVAIPAGIVIFKILNLDETQAPVKGWWDKNWQYRAKIELPVTGLDKSSEINLVKMKVDFTDLMKDRTKVFDENSLRLVWSKDNVFKPVPYRFVKDLDFHPDTNATGELTFRPDESEGEYYLYFDYQEGRPPKAAYHAPADDDYNLTYTAKGLVIQRMKDAASALKMYDDSGKQVFELPPASGKGLYGNFQVSRDYFYVYQTDSGENTCFVNQSLLFGAKKITVDCAPIRRNYYRGEPIKVEFTLSNKSASVLKGETALWLAADNGKIKSAVKYFTLKVSGDKKEVMAIETEDVAQGEYIIVLTTTSIDSELLSLTRLRVYIAPRKREAFLYGLYGGAGTKQEVRELMKVFSENNFNWGAVGAENKTMLDYYADEAIRYGLEYFLADNPYYEPVYSLSAIDKDERATVADGTALFSGYYVPCWNSDKGREISRNAFSQHLKWADQWPSFSKTVSYNDDAWMWLKGDQISCYCHYCRDKFRKLTGLEAPKASEVTKPEPIIPDGTNAWVQWMLFRTRDTYADYHRYICEARDEIDKDVKMFHVRGLMQEPMLVIAGGLYPPYDQKYVGFVSSYYYPNGFRPKMRIITETEIGRMGNREKPVLILSNTEYGHFNVPPWLVKSYFYNMLAANHKAMAFYVYKDNPTLYLTHPDKKDLLEEHKRQGELLKRYGLLFKKFEYPKRKVAVLASFTTLAMDVAIPNQHLGSVKAVYESLMKRHIEADIICDEEVRDGILKNYDLLILPGVAYLSESVYRKINEFIKQKKTVITDNNTTVSFDGAINMATEGIPEKTASLVTPEIEVDSEDITARELVANGIKYYIFVNNYADRKPRLTYRGDGVDNGIAWEEAVLSPVESKVKIKGKGYFIYDVLNGKEIKYVQDGNFMTFTLAFDIADGKVIAVYPEKPTKLNLKAPQQIRRGGEINLNLVLAGANGKKIGRGLYPVTININSPDGKMSEYSGNFLLDNGKLVYRFKTAGNDQIGKWNILVKEESTGLSASGKLEIQ